MSQGVVRLLAVLALALSPAAGAQAFGVWAAATGGFPPLRGTLSVGAGLSLPLIGTLGLELTPFGWQARGAIRGLALVLRDVGIPFTPISARVEAGLERAGTAGGFDGAPASFYLGAGLRYALIGPLGLAAGVRTYVTNGPGITGTLGVDLRF